MSINQYINCPKISYHDFEVMASPYASSGGRAIEHSEFQTERCRACGKVETYGFAPNGQMLDSRRYFLNHIRDFAQEEMGDVYWDTHPGARERKLKEAVEAEKLKIKNEVRDEKFQYAIGKALENKGENEK